MIHRLTANAENIKVFIADAANSPTAAKTTARRRRAAWLLLVGVAVIFTVVATAQLDLIPSYRWGISGNFNADAVMKELTRAAAEDTIPKVIWTYWHSNRVKSITVKACIEGWKSKSPDHQVVIVTPDLLAQFVHVPRYFKRLTPQRQSDWSRLALVSLHGGIWSDATVVATKPFDWVHKRAKYGGMGFYLRAFTKNYTAPVIESWFFASLPRHSFMTAWFHAFDFATEKFRNNGNGYINYLKQTYGEEGYESIRHHIWMAPYLTIHLAAQKAMQVDGVPPFKLYPAENKSQPFGLHTRDDVGWDAVKLIAVLKKPLEPSEVPPIIKLRGHERTAVQAAIKKGSFIDADPASVAAQHIVPFIPII